MQIADFFYAYLTIYLNSSLYSFSLIIAFIGNKMMKHTFRFPLVCDKKWENFAIILSLLNVFYRKCLAL